MKFYSPENQSVICLKLLTPENMENIAYIYRAMFKNISVALNVSQICTGVCKDFNRYS